MKLISEGTLNSDQRVAPSGGCLSEVTLWVEAVLARVRSELLADRDGAVMRPMKGERPE